MINLVSAPGKVMVCGEYVVLDGAEALVAAIDARAYGRLVAAGSGRALPAEAVLARKLAEEEIGPAGLELEIDVSALHRGGRKLGLGSSAAAAVVSAAAVLAWRGGDPARERRRVLHWALAGHRAVAPQGSGADVAASALGGVVRFQRDASETAEMLTWPVSVEAVVVWTGAPARTSNFVSSVRTLAAEQPNRYRAATARLREAAAGMVEAVVSGAAQDVVTLSLEHAIGMAELGESAGVPIVTVALWRVLELARTYGGGAKPSGAGGGDVALAFFDEPDQAAAFRVACEAAGLTPLPLMLGAEGVRAEEAPLVESRPRERG